MPKNHILVCADKPGLKWDMVMFGLAIRLFLKQTKANSENGRLATLGNCRFDTEAMGLLK